MKRCEDVGPWAGRPRAQTMMKSEEVEAMQHLHALGWGLRRIAKEFGCSKNTVRRYVAADGWMSYRRRADGGKLEDQEAWLKERFFRTAAMPRWCVQDLLREQAIDVSLRTVGRAVAPFRRLLICSRATVSAARSGDVFRLLFVLGRQRIPQVPSTTTPKLASSWRSPTHLPMARRAPQGPFRSWHGKPGRQSGTRPVWAPLTRPSGAAGAAGVDYLGWTHEGAAALAAGSGRPPAVRGGRQRGPVADAARKTGGPCLRARSAHAVRSSGLELPRSSQLSAKPVERNEAVSPGAAA